MGEAVEVPASDLLNMVIDQVQRQANEQIQRACMAEMELRGWGADEVRFDPGRRVWVFAESDED